LGLLYFFPNISRQANICGEIRNQCPAEVKRHLLPDTNRQNSRTRNFCVIIGDYWGVLAIIWYSWYFLDNLGDSFKPTDIFGNSLVIQL
jgi:hypothetical protein